MELKDGEFMFVKVVAGNKMSLCGKVSFSLEKKKWVAVVDGSQTDGVGDDSDEAVVFAIKNYLEI